MVGTFEEQRGDQCLWNASYKEKSSERERDDGEDEGRKLGHAGP